MKKQLFIGVGAYAVTVFGPARKSTDEQVAARAGAYHIDELGDEEVWHDPYVKALLVSEIPLLIPICLYELVREAWQGVTSRLTANYSMSTFRSDAAI